MRIGLVAIGAAFALVGSAVIVGVLYPGDGPAVTRTSLADVDGLAGGDWKPFVLNASSTHSATLSLLWSAASAEPGVPPHVNVTLFAAYPCPPLTNPCLSTPALATWGETGSGSWTASGDAGSIYMLYVDALGPSNESVNFSATFDEQYHAGTAPLSMLPFAFTMVGGGLLVGVGGVALYLGLFLPAGVYAPVEPELPIDEPAPPHSRSFASEPPEAPVEPK